MRFWFLVLLCLGCATVAQAQTVVTLAVFAESATDANTATPIGTPITYTAACGLTPKAVEVIPIVNPSHAYLDDPADAMKDCEVIIVAQITALQPGRNYKVAYKFTNNPADPFYGDLSTVFAKQGRKVRLR